MKRWESEYQREIRRQRTWKIVGCAATFLSGAAVALIGYFLFLLYVTAFGGIA